MSKSIKDYIKKKEKAFLGCQIDKSVLDPVNRYRNKLDLSWSSFLEALFKKFLEEEIKKN